MDKLVVHPSISDLKLAILFFKMQSVLDGWMFVNPCSSLSIKYLLIISEQNKVILLHFATCLQNIEPSTL